jgi:hypothetical protein
MATTSFMVRPLFPKIPKKGRALMSAPGKSGIFLCEWHKNLQADPKNDCRIPLPLSSLPAKTPAQSATSSARSPVAAPKGVKCQTDSGFCVPRPAARSLSPKLSATGLEMLWRTLVFGVAAVFIIPIPWVMRWYTTWYVSQFALVERAR